MELNAGPAGMYVLLEDAHPLELYQWIGAPLGRNANELYCLFEGALRVGDVFLPVVRANGYLYHHTPQLQRAQRIMATGFNLSERLNGRVDGDGVYACMTPRAAQQRGTGAVVQIALFDVMLLDSSTGDGYSRLRKLTHHGTSLESRLVSAGIHGLLCSWGAVIYDPARAVPTGYREAGTS